MVIVGLTVFFFVRNLDARRQLPNTKDSAQLYICEQCGHVLNLTPRQLDELIEQTNRMNLEMPSSEGLAVRKMMILACPACKQRAVVSAARCPRCQNPFALMTSDGVRHEVCKDCEKLEAAGTGNSPGTPSANP